MLLLQGKWFVFVFFFFDLHNEDVHNFAILIISFPSKMQVHNHIYVYACIYICINIQYIYTHCHLLYHYVIITTTKIKLSLSKFDKSWLKSLKLKHTPFYYILIYVCKRLCREIHIHSVKMIDLFLNGFMFIACMCLCVYRLSCLSSFSTHLFSYPCRGMIM